MSRTEVWSRERRPGALRSQRDFFLAIDMDAAADHCEQAAIAYEADAVDAVIPSQQSVHVDVVERVTVDGEQLHVAPDGAEPQGFVVLSVELVHQLLRDHGWTYEGATR